MKHLDLFSGIGGFAYAIDQVWQDVEHVFCDNDKFCRAVLKKHWPESEVYDDIKKITADPNKSGRKGKKLLQQRRQSDWWSDQRPFILTGGFPCQPFSAAGLRRGTADDRYLWPEMLRVVRLTKPRWVIAENVGGLVTWNDGMVLEQVCADLEAAGYEVQPFIIPAVAINAPHRRDRIWFVARNTQHNGLNGTQDGKGRTERSNGNTSRPHEVREPEGADSLWADATDPRRERRGEGSKQSLRPKIQEPEQTYSGFSGWKRDWSEVAAEFCSVDDGLPVELDGLKLFKAQHRAAQIKAYGNAIVPQVAIQIMKAIKKEGQNEINCP